MPITQALTEFAPGRVSRRYGINHAFARHWICPEYSEEKQQSIALDELIKSDELGSWKFFNFEGSCK